MAIYVGSSKKLKIKVNDTTCSMKIFSETPITNGVRLLSSDGYILQDSNGVYLTTKEDN